MKRTSILLSCLSTLSACHDGGGGGPSTSGTTLGQLFDGYGVGPQSLVVLQPITPLAPVNPGAGITKFTIQPALPASLSFDAATGTIAGTPTAILPATPFKITAHKGAVIDVETLTLEVRGPLLALSAAAPLVRSYDVTAAPLAFGSGGATLAAGNLVVDEPVLTLVDTSDPFQDGLLAEGHPPTLSNDPVPADHDATSDFVATIDVDTAELSGNAWTLGAKAPYAGLVVEAPQFELDTASVPLQDEDLVIQTQLSTPALGPFDSGTIASERLEFARLSDVVDDLAPEAIESGGKLYFPATVNGASKLYAFDPLGATLVQAVDLNGAGSDDVQLLGAFGPYLLLQCEVNGVAKRPYVFDPATGTFESIAPAGINGPFPPLEWAAIGDELYYTSAASDPAGIVLRWSPAPSGGAASLERASLTENQPTQPEQNRDLAEFQGRLVYLAHSPTQPQWHVFRYDPATRTQERLLSGANAERLQVFGDALYVTLGAPGAATLHRWDEVGRTWVRLNDRLFVDAFHALPGRALLVEARDGSSAPNKLWRVDDGVGGAGFVPVCDLGGPGQSDSITAVLDTPAELLIAGGALGVAKLWAFDWASQTQRQVVDVNGPGLPDDPRDLHLAPHGRVAFTAQRTASGGRTLYLYDPALGRAFAAADPFGGGVDDAADVLARSGERLYFSARDASGAAGLFEIE